MSTRGLWGFVIDGEEKLTYNHSDSYPGGLGETLLRFCRDEWVKDGAEGASDDARMLALVSEQTNPTEEQKRNLRRFLKNPNGYKDDEIDWYWLLRATQGDARKTLDAGHMIDGREFAKDSLFCEWGYVIDLDRGVFEVYRGFQEQDHAEGRFASMFDPKESHKYPPYFDGDDRDENTCISCGAQKDDEAAQEICPNNSYRPIKLVASFPFEDGLPDSLPDYDVLNDR